MLLGSSPFLRLGLLIAGVIGAFTSPDVAWTCIGSEWGELLLVLLVGMVGRVRGVPDPQPAAGLQDPGLPMGPHAVPGFRDCGYRKSADESTDGSRGRGKQRSAKT